LHARLVEFDRAEHIAVVGHGNRRHFHAPDIIDQVFYKTCSVKKAVLGVNMKMYEIGMKHMAWRMAHGAWRKILTLCSMRYAVFTFPSRLFGRAALIFLLS